jgi:hypothetical protein
MLPLHHYMQVHRLTDQPVNQIELKMSGNAMDGIGTNSFVSQQQQCKELAGISDVFFPKIISIYIVQTTLQTTNGLYETVSKCCSMREVRV